MCIAAVQMKDRGFSPSYPITLCVTRQTLQSKEDLKKAAEEAGIDLSLSEEAVLAKLSADPISDAAKQKELKAKLQVLQDKLNVALLVSIDLLSASCAL